MTPPAPVVDRSQCSIGSVNERQPLLSRPSQTPLPWRAITILMIIRLGEPVAATVIFPFINELVARDSHLHLPGSKVGFYSGFVESIFMLGQAITVLQWGRLSDRIGRKPVLLMGSLGTTASLVAFAFSRRVPAMILSRSIAGLLNGNVGVIKAAFGEITDSTNEASAFAILPLGWSLGSAFAPSLGGLTFDRWSPDYPALVPCLLASLFPLTGFLACLFFFEETLSPAVVKERIAGQMATCSTLNDTGPPATASAKPLPVSKLLTMPKVRQVVSIYGTLTLAGIAFTALFSLAAWTDVSTGGLGLSEAHIGTALSLLGIGCAMAQSVGFRVLHPFLGSLGLLKATAPFYAWTFVLLPMAIHLAQQHCNMGEYVALSLALSAFVIASMCSSCLMILVNQSAPSQDSLATMNGIVQTVASLTSALGPASVTTLYALTVQHRVLGGFLVWSCLLAVSVLAVALTWSWSSQTDTQETRSPRDELR